MIADIPAPMLDSAMAEIFLLTERLEMRHVSVETDAVDGPWGVCWESTVKQTDKPSYYLYDHTHYTDWASGIFTHLDVLRYLLGLPHEAHITTSMKDDRP